MTTSTTTFTQTDSHPRAAAPQASPRPSGAAAPRLTSPQRITVFGATGGIGRKTLELALADGHTVTVLVRNRTRLEMTHPRLHVVEGDVRDAASVQRAVAGAETVLICLGAPPSDRSGVRTEGTREILQAMQTSGVRRLVCVSMLGVRESRPALPWFLRTLLIPLWLRHVDRDHDTQEQLIEASGLDWTVVRPPFLTDGPRTDDFAHGFTDGMSDLSMKISREDVAAFLLQQAQRTDYVGRAVAVSYRK